MALSGNFRTGLPRRAALRWIGRAPLAPLGIAVRLTSQATIVTLTGELDLATVPMLDARLAALGGQRAPHLVVDVTALTFCDCSGLGALVRARNQAAARGGWLRLCGAADPLTKTIKIARMASALPCYPGLADALAASAPASPTLPSDAG